MRETPLFFAGNHARLFGVLHEPSNDLRTLPGFVFCHPLAEEKLWAHRVFVSFARALAALGHPVLRFDYMGNGDSDGEFSESTLESMQDDVRSAIAQLAGHTQSRRVSLLGLRLGATIASLVAESAPEVERLILWAPIIDGNRYMQESLRSNLTTQMATYKEIRQDREAMVSAMQQGATVNIDGYDMSCALFAQISAVRLGDPQKEYAGPTLIALVERQQPRQSHEMERLAASYEHSTLVFAQEEPFWKEILRYYQDAPNLFDLTMSWLKT